MVSAFNKELMRNAPEQIQPSVNSPNRSRFDGLSATRGLFRSLKFLRSRSEGSPSLTSPTLPIPLPRRRTFKKTTSRHSNVANPGDQAPSPTTLSDSEQPFKAPMASPPPMTTPNGTTSLGRSASNVAEAMAASNARSQLSQATLNLGSAVTPHPRMMARDETNFYVERRFSIARAVKELEEANPDLTTNSPVLAVKATSTVEDEHTTRVSHFLGSAANLKKRMNPSARSQSLHDLFVAVRNSKIAKKGAAADAVPDRGALRGSNENDRLTVNTLEREMDIIETSIAVSEETEEELEKQWRRMSTRERQIALVAYRHEHSWRPKRHADMPEMETVDGDASPEQTQRYSHYNEQRAFPPRRRY